MAQTTFKWMERVLGLIAVVTLLFWSVTKIEATRYQNQAGQALDAAMASTTAKPPLPHSWIGRLEIPRFDFSVMVLEGDDDAALKLGIGHVPGTSIPGQNGNAALAGHRDTFFRPLRNIKVGDEIRWTSPGLSGRYRVESMRVVAPSETEILNPTEDSTLTLITCYPFNFIGPAPERFVVRARHITD